MPRGLHDPAGVIRTFRKVVTPWKGGAVVGRDSRSFIRRGRPRDVRVWRRRLGRAVAPRGSRRRLQKSQSARDGGGVACAGVGQGAPGGDGGWQGGSLPSTPKVHRDSFILLCFFV